MLPSGTQKCIDRAMRCLQRKPGDLGCVGKAQGKCVAAVVKGLGATALAKHQQRIVKACTKPELSVADILAPTGLSMQTHDPHCTEPAASTGASVPASPSSMQTHDPHCTEPLDSVGKIAQCLGQQ